MYKNTAGLMHVKTWFCGGAMAQKVLQYKENERIITAGNLEKRMYIILEGSVEIALTDGTHRIVVATLKKGDFFGEISLFNNTPRSASVNALEDVKLAYVDSIENLRAFLLKNPAFAAKMVHILAQRLAKTDELLIGKISEINRIKALQM